VDPVVTPAEMAECDRRTIAAGTPVEVLMDRAGRAVAWEVRRRLDGCYGRRVVVACGKGNNGGDGRVVARVLEGWGVRVDVLDVAEGVAAEVRARALDRADLLVDAMYGTGFRGTLDGDAAAVAAASERLPTVAVDIPSGVDGATGAAEGAAVRADATVTFAARKPGLCFEPGRSRAGAVRVVDIGIDVGDATIGVVTDDDLRAWVGSARPADTNKWRSGVFVVGGSGGMTGAPLMVSRAAMRVGAGIVWCAMPGQEAAAAASGGEVITKALPASRTGALSGLDGDLVRAAARFRVAAVGPGLGGDRATVAAVRELVATLTVPLVLDADGLNAFAGDAALLRDRAAPTILTPHAAEYERLLDEPVGPDRVEAARRLAAATGCVALVKGPGTVVAAPDGRVAVNIVDGPWLGTAGSGDVLTGVIAGLLAAAAADPFEAAAGGALVHGRAADVAGHTGLVAGDLVEALPRTLEHILGDEILSQES
jgi:NAD(P)H-hydrate epimerase